MLLDIYRDQALEKLLIVEHKKNINELRAIDSDFLKDLSYHTEVSTEDGALPTGLSKEDVLKAVRTRGYFAARFVVELKELEDPS